MLTLALLFHQAEIYINGSKAESKATIAKGSSINNIAEDRNTEIWGIE